MIGQLLANYLIERQYEVVILSRNAAKVVGQLRYVEWDASTLGPWVQELEHSEGIINLTGKTISSKPTKANKEEIIRSRVVSTKLVGQAINECKVPPKVWLNAGGAGVFSGVDRLPKDESSPLGTEFAAHVARLWEEVFESVPTPLTRKVYARFGLVLKAHEGLLAPLETLVKWGLGGVAGSGQQYFPWIHYQDLLQIVHYLLTQQHATGLYHVVGPNPVTNATFMKALRKVHNVPFGLPAPAIAVKVGAYLIGTNGALALSDNHVLPRRLQDEKYAFLFPELTAALTDLYR